MKPPIVNSPLVLLEQGTIASLRKARERQSEYERFYWDQYFELQFQRDKIKEQIFEVLNTSCTSNFDFSSWQRSVKYRFGLHPLCVLGSLNDPGGRFNIGDFNTQTFEPFPALYVARDKKTALVEHLFASDERESGAEWELALTKPTSVTIVAVSGHLDRLFDMRATYALRPLVKLLSQFNLSNALKSRAQRLGIVEPVIVSTAAMLKKSLEDKKWRRAPMLYDIPANPQIFGHLIYAAKIEAVLYKSTLTGKDCLAIFPRNFIDTTSFVELDDETPMDETPARLDCHTWGQSEVQWKSILGR